ncbi:hypothetical protein SVIO_005320 [Streptomyces violaceusniger]|uniref:Uncharacterized protein n=1 Tax=Streptomyces violaceusniger TaxID=68280 RepID=A0A4D4KVP3_STRVO|nr:hypothetical protein SVIO_005320 [Streptomyces violaceusniger]
MIYVYLVDGHRLASPAPTGTRPAELNETRRARGHDDLDHGVVLRSRSSAGKPRRVRSGDRRLNRAFGDPEAERDEARDPFDLYVEHGDNFIDTANTHTNGSSERLPGESTRDNRESLVSRMQTIIARVTPAPPCNWRTIRAPSEELGAAGAFEQHRVHDGRPDVRANGHGTVVRHQYRVGVTEPLGKRSAQVPGRDQCSCPAVASALLALTMSATTFIRANLLRTRPVAQHLRRISAVLFAQLLVADTDTTHMAGTTARAMASGPT